MQRKGVLVKVPQRKGWGERNTASFIRRACLAVSNQLGCHGNPPLFKQSVQERWSVTTSLEYRTGGSLVRIVSTCCAVTPTANRFTTVSSTHTAYAPTVISNITHTVRTLGNRRQKPNGPIYIQGAIVKSHADFSLAANRVNKSKRDDHRRSVWPCINRRYEINRRNCSTHA